MAPEKKAIEICLVSTSHLAANPRMLKEANALANAGYRVRVISTQWDEEWREQDGAAAHGALWRWQPIDWSRRSGPGLFWSSRVRYHLAARLRARGLTAMPRSWSAGRIVPELCAAAASEPADLFIGHNAGSLPAIFAAREQFPFARVGYDAEDFVPGITHLDCSPSFDELCAIETERHFMPQCDYVTAAAPLIAAWYEKEFGISIGGVVLNTFPVAWQPATRIESNAQPLRLFWFSQTIGARRGLEDIIQAMALSKPRTIELHLLGRWQTGYRERLLGLAAEVGVSSAIKHHPLTSRRGVISAAAGMHVGLALEQECSVNGSITLSNKLFSYLIGGNAIIMTATKGQAAIAPELGRAAVSYSPGDTDALAAVLIGLYDDRSALEQARQTSLEVSRTRFNWEMEQKQFLNVVEATLEKVPARMRVDGM